MNHGDNFACEIDAFELELSYLIFWAQMFTFFEINSGHSEMLQ